eukprot:scaffold14367_cov250-Ochromonas_danica.AAC.28
MRWEDKRKAKGAGLIIVVVLGSQSGFRPWRRTYGAAMWRMKSVFQVVNFPIHVYEECGDKWRKLLIHG